MTSSARFSLRLGVYVVIVAYFCGDLFLFNGPLNRRIQASRPDSPESIAAAKANGVVAQVFNHGITRSQLDRAVAERLWLSGKSPDSLTPESLKLIRYAALGELIDHQLIRLKVSVNTLELPVSDEEITPRLDALAARFPDEAALAAAMRSEGISSRAELRERIAARIQQEKYVASRVTPLIGVTDEEIAEWHAQHQAGLATPERVEARHVFLSTHTRPVDEARTILDAALADLAAKTKDFTTLVQDLSEDPATREAGGALGWLTRDRLPPDLAVPLFDLPQDQPAILRSKLGLHLVEVTGRKPAEPRSIEESRAEIVAAIESRKRRQAVADFRQSLRRFEGHRVRIFHDMLAD